MAIIPHSIESVDQISDLVKSGSQHLCEDIQFMRSFGP